ncbi:MAG TPA: hypothetical protein VGX00_08555 [Thermoplasmata archaeon]|nr:hypothetical protein [Thermoplasmata archaeon]
MTMSSRLSTAGTGSFLEDTRLFASGSGTLSTVPLSLAEEDAFDDNLEHLAGIQCLPRSLGGLLLDARDLFKTCAELAKAQFDGAVFAGSSAQGPEIGMGLIRAATVRNVGIAPATPIVETWVQSYEIGGWTNVFGSSAAPVDLSQYGLGSGPTYTRGRTCVLVDALIDPAVPILMTEINFNVDGVTYPVESLSWLPVVDLAYYKLPYPIFCPVDSRFVMRGNISGPGMDQTQLFGITYSTGGYLSGE